MIKKIILIFYDQFQLIIHQKIKKSIMFYSEKSINQKTKKIIMFYNEKIYKIVILNWGTKKYLI